MALEPITRQEQIIAGRDLEPITRMEKFLKQYGGGSGGVSSYNDLTDRPFWMEKTKKPFPFGVITVTTNYDDESGFNFATGNVGFAKGATNYVVFDGVEYECEPHYSDVFEEVGIGSSDSSFSDYPFFIMQGIIATKTTGEHTVEQFYGASEVKAEYFPLLRIQTGHENGQIYLHMEDVEKIVYAYKNGVPIIIRTTVKNLIVNMQVIDVSESYIFAYGAAEHPSGMVQQAVYLFGVSDGSLESSGISYLGSVTESSNICPVMYINNIRYKITVSDDGNLKATKIT